MKFDSTVHEIFIKTYRRSRKQMYEYKKVSNENTIFDQIKKLISIPTYLQKGMKVNVTNL